MLKQIAWCLVVCRMPMVTSLIFHKLRWVLPKCTRRHPSMTISFSLTPDYPKIFIRWKKKIRRTPSRTKHSIEVSKTKISTGITVRRKFSPSRYRTRHLSFHFSILLSSVFVHGTYFWLQFTHYLRQCQFHAFPRNHREVEGCTFFFEYYHQRGKFLIVRNQKYIFYKHSWVKFKAVKWWSIYA